MKLFVASVALCLSGFSAMADKAVYCETYARDFADRSAAGTASWEHKFSIAKVACLGLGGTPAAPKAAARAGHAKLSSQADRRIDRTSPLVPRSPAWNDYCAQKYASFDAKTGLYLSRTGVKRQCLVTNDVPQPQK